jgi:hypothetical protein
MGKRMNARTAEFPAKRKFVMRVDASVKTAERTIAEVFGLPEECVRLLLPSGKKARTDKTIGSLIRDWNA